MKYGGQLKDKVKHETWEQANKHLISLSIHNPGIKYEMYQCGHCQYWHVGHAKRDKAFKRYLRKETSYDDILVGKLIAALKVVLGDTRTRA